MVKFKNKYKIYNINLFFVDIYKIYNFFFEKSNIFLVLMLFFKNPGDKFLNKINLSN
jgi:hypothetical protein